jgi:6-phosphofructokinase
LAFTITGFTGFESRITIPGHLQRGGTPWPAGRRLVTRLGISLGD